MSHYFRPSSDMPQIYLYRQPVNFRKNCRGLAAIVEQELGHSIAVIIFVPPAWQQVQLAGDIK